MAAITAANVTYTINKRKELEDGRLIVQATIAFGNASLTYPTTGIPLTMGSLGCQLFMDSVTVISTRQSGYLGMYDSSSGGLRLFESTTGAPALLVEVANTAAPAATTVDIEVIGK